MQAQFITLDGIDGSGKSTNIEVIKNWFTKQNLPVYFTREPGGTALGESLRNILLNPETKISLRTETLLMFAARQQHLEEVIFPKLQQGIHVVSDRFTDATFAYQGGGRGIPIQDIEQLEKWVQGNFHPNLTFILDVPLEVSIARISQSRQKDRFEQEQADFFNRVRSVYLNRAHSAPHRYVIIDSSQDKLTTKQHIEETLTRHFNQLNTTNN